MSAAATCGATASQSVSSRSSAASLPTALQPILRLDPEARLRVVLVRLGIAAVRDPCDRSVHADIAAGPPHARTETGNAAMVVAVVPGLGVDGDLARVVEHIGRELAHRVTQFDLRQPAPVTRALALREGAHAARAAETEALRGIEVVAGQLPREASEQREVLRQPLQPCDVEVPLLETAFGFRSEPVLIAQVARIERKIANGPCQSAIRDAAAGELIARIELQADRHAVARFLVLDVDRTVF